MKQFLPVPLAGLRLDQVTGFDLYLCPDLDKPPVLYRENHLAFTQHVRDRLRDTGVTALWTPTDQQDAYYDYLQKNLQLILQDSTIELEDKVELLYDSAQRTVQDFFVRPDAPELPEQSRQLVEYLLSMFAESDDAFSVFMRVAPLDYQTYTHSVNVFVYSVQFARRLDLVDLPSLHDFALGTLLHDLGKSRVPSSILQKPGKLTEDEWVVIRKHPGWGCELLLEHGLDSDLILSITRHHHEKLNGVGYPDGLQNGAIDPRVRAVTICDIFDALTTRRPYKERMSTFDALRIMKQDIPHALDNDMFKIFVEMLSDPRETVAQTNPDRAAFASRQ
ncbi:MAG: HD domain-containing phosphohydrolase [Candidatus Hydrogenedentales bacterium]